MIRSLRVRRWLKAALTFAVCYFSLDLLMWAVCRKAHIASMNAEARRALGTVHTVVICATAAFWTLGRASKHHPISNGGYRNWLRSTPWHPGMPLPLGPTTLAWADGLVLVVLVALAQWHARVSVIPPILCFCCAYVLSSLSALSKTFPWGAYACGLGLAFVLRTIQVPEVAVVIAGALAAVAQFSLDRSLRGFPWEIDASQQPPETPGWLAMIPNDYKPLVPTRRAIAICIIITCWTWAPLSFFDPRFTPAAAMLLVILAAMLGSLIRWAKYCGSYKPPLTPWGRLLTGRLVIPGYDHALLAPLVAPIAAGALSLLLVWVGAPASVISGAGIAVILGILLLSPPNFRVWQLTGFHRRIPFARTRLAGES